jgi:hypothetical protein
MFTHRHALAAESNNNIVSKNFPRVRRPATLAHSRLPDNVRCSLLSHGAGIGLRPLCLPQKPKPGQGSRFFPVISLKQHIKKASFAVNL